MSWAFAVAAKSGARATNMTNSAARLIAIALMALVALTSNLAAQEPPPTPPNPTLAGHYEILDENGDPVEEGHVWKETIIQPFPFVPFYVSVVTRDDEVQEDESCNYTPDGSGGYDFTNSAGRTGVLTPDGNGWKSVMTSGPNAGNTTKLSPIE